MYTQTEAGTNLPMITRLLITCSLCLLLSSFISVLKANDQNALAGSAITQDDATKKSSMVFVGTIEEIGPPVARPIGQKRFYGVKVTATDVLRGEVAQHILVLIIVRIDLEETSPKANEQYVFFGNPAGVDGVDVVKLLSVDNNTLSQLAKLRSQ